MTRCECSCHAEARANYNEACQRKDWPAVLIFSRVETVNVNVPVESDDVIEAAAACAACRNMHCNALLSRYVPDPEAYRDPPFPPPAEASTDDSDGN